MLLPRAEKDRVKRCYTSFVCVRLLMTTAVTDHLKTLPLSSRVMNSPRGKLLNIRPYFEQASCTVGTDTMGISSSKCCINTLQQQGCGVQRH